MEVGVRAKQGLDRDLTEVGVLLLVPIAWDAGGAVRLAEWSGGIMVCRPVPPHDTDVPD